MNVFYLDNDPKLAAQYHHNGHLTKLILEAAQLLSTAVRLNTATNSKVIYKPTHTKHPCTIACTTNSQYFKYVAELGIALNEERRWRLDKDDHKSFFTILECYKYVDIIPNNDITIPQAMPDMYKRLDHVHAYRNYYIGAKMHDKNGRFMMYYGKRGCPFWFNSALKDIVTIKEKEREMMF